MPHRSVVIYFCLAVILVALGVAAWREYFAPDPSDVNGEKSRRLRRKIYVIELVAWIIIGIAQFWK